jgi:hypothetical protein
MAGLQQIQAQSSRRATAALLSLVLHLVLVALIVLSGGRASGIREDVSAASRLLLLEAGAMDPRAGEGRSRFAEAMPPWGTREPPAPPATESPAAAPPQVDLPRYGPPPVPPPAVEIPLFEPEGVRLVDVETEEATRVAPPVAAVSRSAVIMADAQASELQQRIERLAADLANEPRKQVTWQQDGRDYTAELVLEPARSGVEPESARVEISTEEQGRRISTWISLKRLPFSHFAKLIDWWDPMVQLHDDEVIGRMHVNSRFNVLYDAQAAPRLAGKVTTAAGGFNLDARGRRRDSEVFIEGIETGAGRIPLTGQGQSFDWATQRDDALVHALADDTWIRFLGAAGYSWREGRFGEWKHSSAPSAGQSVLFLATQGAVVHVQGIVSGKFLVYSPRRIVVQGDVTYARDPRAEPDSGDYLGLVSDRDIEVAPPHVTGPGNLDIHAALFARRRMVVTEADRPSTATLGIFGSLAAGSMTETEPRYATRVEYDPRFDRQRPPGFPSTNRFAVEEWDRRWIEVPGAASSAGHSPEDP